MIFIYDISRNVKSSFLILFKNVIFLLKISKDIFYIKFANLLIFQIWKFEIRRIRIFEIRSLKKNTNFVFSLYRFIILIIIITNNKKNFLNLNFPNFNQGPKKLYMYTNKERLPIRKFRKLRNFDNT